jgi:hypothetical protein
MSQTYDNTNSGILMRNKRQRDDKDPSHQGAINVDGVEYWLSAWIKEGKPGSKLDGERFFSLKINPKDAEKSTPTLKKPKPAPAAAGEFQDDDIPF